MITPISARRRPVAKARYAQFRQPLFGLLLGSALGVSGCVTTQDVDPLPEKQRSLESRVKSALIEASDVDAAAIEVTLAEKTLLLEGFVASDEEARQALKLAREAVPERDIESRLEVK